MSHVAAVNCYVTDLDDLEAVADRLGFKLVRGATSYAWFGRWMNDYNATTAAVTQGFDPKTFGTCEHKLTLKDHRAGDYEIGLVERRDGQPGWEMLYDNWSTGGARIHERAGRNLETMKNELLAESSMRVMKRKGYRVTRTVADGKIKLTATK